jgi:hypothetical protein
MTLSVGPLNVLSEVKQPTLKSERAAARLLSPAVLTKNTQHDGKGSLRTTKSHGNLSSSARDTHHSRSRGREKASPSKQAPIY